MKTNATTATSRWPATDRQSEILILADGKILAHNLTPALAQVLAQLNPADENMKSRAEPGAHLKHELPN